MTFSLSPGAECRVWEGKGEQGAHGTLVHSARATAQVTELGLQLENLHGLCLPLTQILPGVSERSLDGRKGLMQISHIVHHTMWRHLRAVLRELKLIHA